MQYTGNQKIQEALKCIWMGAGVVDYKLCSLNFDCENCPFDRVIRGVGIRETLEPGDELGFRLNHSVFYHPAHVWVRVEEEGKVRVGLDDFAQKLAGRVYLTQLPGPGSETQPDRSCWAITHALGQTQLCAGVRGKIVCKNERLEQLPSLINTDPYGEGWAFVLEPENLQETLKSLVYGKEARNWYSHEIHELRTMLGESHGMDLTIQDGGVLAPNWRDSVNEAMIHKFLSARVLNSTESGTKSARR